MRGRERWPRHVQFTATPWDTRHHGVASVLCSNQEFIMSRTLQALRASIAVGAFLIASAAAHAADPTVQRVAMARTQAGDTAAVAHATRPAPSMQRADVAVAKAPVRRGQRVDARDSDGSRFTYDSCGCSN
jgi:hypothetical protein